MKKPEIEQDIELQKHIQLLGLSTIKDYTSWCKAQGLSQGLNKNKDQRKREINHFKDLKTKEAVERSKARLQSTDKVIKGVLDNKISEMELSRDPKLRRIYDMLKTFPQSDRNDFLDLVCIIEQKSDLLSSEAVVHDFNNQQGNTFIEGLKEVFFLKDKWIRSLKDWEPKSHNKLKQFSSLVRHLFTNYAIPVFMDSSWFSANPVHREWFLHVAGGGNMRKAPKIPFELTKKMAHSFLQAPDHYTMDKAIRWGQIIGAGGDVRLVEAVIQTEIGRSFNDNNFWEQVIQLFILNPMLDRHQFGPIVDYIRNQKYGANAPQPNFCMKGRTADSLMKQTEEWHNRLAKERPKNFKEWKPTGITAFRKEEGFLGRSSYKVWTIKELLTSKDLFQEGRSQSHCVGSYSYSCVAGRTSIWSLRCLDHTGVEATLLTIEVNNQNQSVVQARGKFNKSPDQRTYGLLCEWASLAGLSVQV